METALVLAGAAALAAVPILLVWYWQRLPEAPACPHCRAVTQRLPHRAPGHRLLNGLALPVTAVRGCSRCGWQGRMRWRWAPDPARRE